LTDLAADRLLGEVELTGGPRHAAVLGNGRQRLQQP
jgi:hypothetical protein